MMLGSQDALRIVPYFVSSYSLRSVLNVCHWHTAPHNPAQYSHIVKLTLHFYVYAPLRSVQNEHPLDVLHHIGRVTKPKNHSCASTSWFQAFDPGIIEIKINCRQTQEAQKSLCLAAFLFSVRRYRNLQEAAEREADRRNAWKKRL